MTLEETTMVESEPGERSPVSQVPAIAWWFPTAQRAIHHLQRASMLIGRDDECAIRLMSSYVSRRHAEIYRQGPIHAIRDLGSRNGVYVHGRRVVHAPLRQGQLIRIGAHIGQLTTIVLPWSEPEPWRVEELAPGLIGGIELKSALRPLRRAAAHKLPVIVQGETGSGKELVARAIHQWSGRSGPFHAINCAAIPAAMVEGELFGYRRGAFTGASTSHVGHVRAAHRGTLFLDEILDLPIAAQATLLRVLERDEVIPLGESKSLAVDVLVICATQRCLRTAVQEGRFRADLHARLAGYTCVLPALRNRAPDISALFESFLHRFSSEAPFSIDVRLIERLCLYEWPQNVRELELLARSLSILHQGEKRLGVEHLPEHMRCGDSADEASAHGTISGEALNDRKDYERKRLLAELERSNGNMARAAARVGVSRQRAYRLIGDRGPDPDADPASTSPSAVSETRLRVSATGLNTRSFKT